MSRKVGSGRKRTLNLKDQNKFFRLTDENPWIWSGNIFTELDMEVTERKVRNIVKENGFESVREKEVPFDFSQ